MLIPQLETTSKCPNCQNGEIYLYTESETGAAVTKTCYRCNGTDEWYPDWDEMNFPDYDYFME